MKALAVAALAAALVLAAGLAQESHAQNCRAGEVMSGGQCVPAVRESANTMNLSVEKTVKDADACASGDEGAKCRQSASETDRIFDDADVMILKGTVSSFTEKSAVTIIIRDPAGNIAHFAQANPVKSTTANIGTDTNPRSIPGAFEITVKPIGPKWKAEGDYKVSASYGTDKSEITFAFTGSDVGGASNLGEVVPPTPPGGENGDDGDDPPPPVVQEKLVVKEVLADGLYVISEDQLDLVPAASIRGLADNGTDYKVEPSALGLADDRIEVPPPKPVLEKLAVKEVLDDGSYVVSADQLGLIDPTSILGPAANGADFKVDPAKTGLSADRVTLPPPKPAATTPPEPEKPDTPEKPVCGEGTVADADGVCQLIQQDNRSGCLVATAAYGSEFAPQVQALREIRDGTLYSTEAGASFMSGFNDIYYAFSPAVADLEREHPLFKEAVRLALSPMLASLGIMSLAEPGSEQQVLGYGLAVIALNLGMYVGVPAGAVAAARRR